jgi:zinc transporter 9
MQISSMWSLWLFRSIHSFMDVINQALLLIGIRRSIRTPNLEHPYGFHREQYAWAMISAMGKHVIWCDRFCIRFIHLLEYILLI